MIISNLVGGLGNQMFQYACARSLSLQLNLPLKFTIEDFDYYDAHNGFEIERIFDININIATNDEIVHLVGLIRKFPITRRFLSRLRLPLFNGKKFIVEPHFSHWPKLLEHATTGGYLHGYWQSELYFASNSSQIRTDFVFRDKLRDKNLHLARSISEGNSISVHVRRGDYVNNAKTLAIHGTCSPEYYFAAIDRLLLRCPGSRLFAFSDDTEWVSKVLQPRYSEMIIVDNNKGVDSYNDMRLMSMCRHHIIANSSFSWWGAWLNSR
jgi:hypothetical protein